MKLLAGLIVASLTLSYHAIAAEIAVGEKESVSNLKVTEFFDRASKLIHPYTVDSFAEPLETGNAISGGGVRVYDDGLKREDGSTISRNLVLQDGGAVAWFSYATPDHDFGDLQAALNGTKDYGRTVVGLVSKSEDGTDPQIIGVKIYNANKTRADIYELNDGNWTRQQYSISE